MKQGYIYIGFDGTSKYFKIGKSVDTDRRLKEIRNMNPTFEILLQAPVDNPTLAEACFHQYFESKRVVGEWFNLSLEDISDLTSGRITIEMIQAEIDRKKQGSKS